MFWWVHIIQENKAHTPWLTHRERVRRKWQCGQFVTFPFAITSLTSMRLTISLSIISLSESGFLSLIHHPLWVSSIAVQHCEIMKHTFHFIASELGVKQPVMSGKLLSRGVKRQRVNLKGEAVMWPSWDQSPDRDQAPWPGRSKILTFFFPPKLLKLKENREWRCCHA